MTKPKDQKKDLELRKKELTSVQYEVTQKDHTETPFHNEYWNNHQEGIYVDIVSGEPLFSSEHKYDSKTGWPSFFTPLEPNNLIEREDKTLSRTRTELRSKNADSHLGHVFDDGPRPTGKRYCLNSAALRFIPKEDLVAEGYGKYASRFQKKKKIEVAYFAGGCFWCVEEDFLKIKGVIDVESGFLGGDEKNPSYEQVSSGTTKHREAVKVSFNPEEISYDDLLKVFWLSIDPTVKDRQFADVGYQYGTAIFFENDKEEEAIKRSITWLKEQFPDISPVTEILKAKEFYKAEDYHQRYAKKNPLRYQAYRVACGRASRLKELYKDKRENLLRYFLREG